MLRGVFIFGLMVAGVFYLWDRGITQGRLAAYIETHPTTYQGERILYGVASFHELWNQDRQALLNYQRLTKIYPDSPMGDDAQYGVASSYERLNDRKRAYEESLVYLKKYPNGRHQKTVNFNVGYLKN